MIIQKLDDYYIVKIFKEKLGDFNPFDKSCIEKLFQKILKKLLKNYSIHGLIDADIYFDRLYGMIIELREVYDYFDDIDLKIHFHLDSVFLVEIEYDYFNKMNDVYYYKGKYYKVYDKIIAGPIIYTDSECTEIMEKGIHL